MSERPHVSRSFLVVARVFSVVVAVYTCFLLMRLASGADTFRVIQAVIFVAMTVFWLWYGWWGLVRRRDSRA